MAFYHFFEILPIYEVYENVLPENERSRECLSEMLNTGQTRGIYTI